MFALIVSILAIALVALTVLATTYWGGSAFSGGASQAKLNRLLNLGSQINAALVAYRGKHGAWPPTVAYWAPHSSTPGFKTRLPASLVPTYLRAWPNLVPASFDDAYLLYIGYTGVTATDYRLFAALYWRKAGGYTLATPQQFCQAVNARLNPVGSCVRCATRQQPSFVEAFITLNHYWAFARMKAGAWRKTNTCH